MQNSQTVLEEAKPHSGNNATTSGNRPTSGSNHAQQPAGDNQHDGDQQPLHSDDSDGLKPRAEIGVTIGFAIGFGALVLGLSLAVLFMKIGATGWDQLVYLLSGVEAVTFAAIGWLFGKEVNRGQAREARTNGRLAARNAALAGEKSGESKVLTHGLRSLKAGTQSLGDRHEELHGMHQSLNDFLSKSDLLKNPVADEVNSGPSVHTLLQRYADASSEQSNKIHELQSNLDLLISMADSLNH